MADMERAASPPRRQRACEPCTKAKARCNFRPENIESHICDRCQRIGIDCAAKTAKSIRKPRQLKPLASRVEFLEQKLATLITTEGQDSSPSQDIGSQHRSQSILTSDSRPGSPSSYRQTQSQSSRTSDNGHSDQNSLRTALDTLQHSLPSFAPPPYGLTWEQGALILNDFRTRFSPMFPFVLVDPSITALELLKVKPFLFRAIMLAAAPLPAPRIAKIYRSVMAYLSHHMLVENEETLDLLQGLLVVIAWGDLKFFLDKQITKLTYLALGYAHQLGITQIPYSLLVKYGAASNSTDCLGSKKQSSTSDIHTLEEQRAYLGLYYVIAINSSKFNHRPPLPSQYVDICCESVFGAMESPTDLMLEKMIRVAQVSNKTAEAFGSTFDRATGKSYAVLLEGQARAIRLELGRIAETIGPQHPQFHSFWASYNYQLVLLYEPAASMLAQPQGSTSTLYRSQCLFNCLHAAKAYLDSVFCIPADALLCHTFASLNSLQTVVILAANLLLLDVDGWDNDIARLTLDFGPVIERIIDLLTKTEDARRRRIRNFAAATGMRVDEQELREPSVFGRWINKTKWTGKWFEGKISLETVDMPGTLDLAMMEAELEEAMTRIHEDPQTSNDPWFFGMLSNSAWNFDNI